MEDLREATEGIDPQYLENGDKKDDEEMKPAWITSVASFFSRCCGSKSARKMESTEALELSIPSSLIQESNDSRESYDRQFIFNFKIEHPLYDRSLFLLPTNSKLRQFCVTLADGRGWGVVWRYFNLLFILASAVLVCFQTPILARKAFVYGDTKSLVMIIGFAYATVSFPFSLLVLADRISILNRRFYVVFFFHFLLPTDRLHCCLCRRQHYSHSRIRVDPDAKSLLAKRMASP
jgi:hypothetical protein